MDKKEERHLRFIQGRVVSDKMDKTRVILVEKLIRHPQLKKTIKRSRRYKIHDEKNESKIGDLVKAIETRPLSKEKRHRISQILERAT